MKRRYVIFAVVAGLLVAAVLYLYGGSETPSGQTPLRNLTADNIAEIKNEFNAVKSDVRFVLLLSPT